MAHPLLICVVLTGLWGYSEQASVVPPNRYPTRSIRVDTLPPQSATATEPDQPDTSQYITVQTQAPATFMSRNVAFVSEFIKRLNYQRTPDNQPMDSVNRRIYMREPYLRDLFNEEDPRLNPRSPKFSLAYKIAVDDFVTDVVKDTATVFLADAHEQLFAEVVYDFRYKDTTIQAKVYLKMFRTGRAYDWKILDSENPLPQPGKRNPATIRSDSGSVLFITSQTHETRFQNLFSHLQKHRNLFRLMPTGQPIGPAMKALAEAVLDSSITVERTRAVHLYMNTRRNWVLRLDDFVRAKENAGWLIADLYGGTSPSQLPRPIAQYLHRTK